MQWIVNLIWAFARLERLIWFFQSERESRDHVGRAAARGGGGRRVDASPCSEQNTHNHNHNEIYTINLIEQTDLLKSSEV